MPEIFLSDKEQIALDRLATNGPIFGLDIPFDDYFAFVRLKDIGYAVQELPNPNFLHELTDERKSAYQFKITPDGYNEYIRLKQMRDERAKQEEAQRAKDAQVALDKKQDRRHDFKVAAFGGAVTLFVEHFGRVVDCIEVIIEKILLLFH